MENMIVAKGLVAALVVLTSGLAFAESFPVIGATYQLDRAKYPGKVAICTTEDAMSTYMEAQDSNDNAKAKKMLFEVETINDIARMKKAGGCTLISSSSQAKITKKGIEAHEAEFAAFPFGKMWGYYLYFGGRVK